jgi:hypothetical protein
MKLEISVNFDFGKLAGNVEKLTQDYVEGFARNSEKISKEIIDSGKLAPLKPSTVRWRKQEGHPTSPPLKKSGELYNSIKAEGNVLSLKKYGKYHNDGKVPTTVARPFISGVGITDIKNREKFDKKFMQDLRKALRSNVKVASIG